MWCFTYEEREIRKQRIKNDIDNWVISDENVNRMIEYMNGLQYIEKYYWTWFEENYMCEPKNSKWNLFEKDVINNRLIPDLERAQYAKILWPNEWWREWWEVYQKRQKDIKSWEVHKYWIGIDLADWVWRDHTVVQVLDFTTWKLVAEMVSNEIQWIWLFEEVRWAIQAYKNVKVWPEQNHNWLWFNDLMYSKWYWWYLGRKPWLEFKEFKEYRSDNYWFRSTQSTNQVAMTKLVTLYSEGSLDIMSEGLLKEFRIYQKGMELPWYKDKDVTNHLDRISAFRILCLVSWIKEKKDRLDEDLNRPSEDDEDDKNIEKDHWYWTPFESDYWMDESPFEDYSEETEIFI